MSGLAYRRDELEIKARLETLTGRVFRKEVIGEKIVDFADDDLLIEHTLDHTRGLSEAIERLNGIHDKRKKILITRASRLGPIRRERCIGIAVVDVDDDQQIITLCSQPMRV